MKAHESYKRLMEAAGKLPTPISSAADLARYLTIKGIKVSPQMMTNWKARGVSRDASIDLAPALGVTPDYIIYGNKAPFGMLFAGHRIHEDSNVSGKLPLRGRVPIISFVAAGNWSEAVDNLAPGTAEEWIETTVSVRRHTYALKVQGDSMEPKFPDGAIIIVEPEEEPRNGNFVIVRQNGSEATFKQLVYDGDQAYLKPLNSRYPIMAMRQDAVICGVVKQMIMDV